MSDPAYTVFIVDDDIDVLRALERVLKAAGYGVRTYTSPVEFLAEHDAGIPGCAVLDVSMPGLDGLELQAALATSFATRAVVFLTGAGDIPTSVRAMRAGAIDFLTKPASSSDLIAAIERAIARDADARRISVEVAVIEARLSKLTPREREVLALVAAGRLNKQIAGELGTSEKTIKVHRGRVMEKMGVRTVADLVRLLHAVERP
ncbi:MAG: response regulator transcription factor [Mesorhizobium sp.]|uniref:response regulator transcription factor n=1 Tax=Mesorhizobium sp. TaxID=1871066 RepID=UPI001222210B|nr:response regulator [Mesorhizobium sp.]TIQ23088.1 MAG: response regulator transcription factor [Mesorhizobium sp.]